jgi:microcystin-dependent protein
MALGTEKIAETFLNIVVNTPIDCDWPLYAEDEVEVVYGSASLLAVYNTDYTVTLSGPNYDQFQITPLASLLTKINNLIVADPTNEINYITVRRVLDYKTSVTPESVRGVAFLSREVERIHMRFQQLSEIVTRCVKFPRKEVGDDESDPSLPGKDLRANKAAIFDADGNATVSEDDYADQLADVTAQAVIATTQAGIATTQAGIATTQAGIATTKATQTAADAVQTAADRVQTGLDRTAVASDKATVAADKATVAADKATVAADKGTVATDKGIVAADKAIVAADKATVAADKATTQGYMTAAQSAQTAAEAARDATLAAYDSFDDRYLGAKTSDPTLDNDGNALVAGSLYYNSVTQVMMLYNGSGWVAAYVSGAGYLAAANNLSDVANAGTARTNLGLGSIATLNSIATANLDNDAVTFAKLQNISQYSFIGRIAAGSGDASELTITQVIDAVGGTPAQGDILYRGSGAWTRLAPGTAGQVLTTGGAGANPSWADSVVAGTIVDTARSSAPTGWLLCAGQAVSRTTYAALFSAISTTYGAGDGSTTFNLPDCRGRVRAGVDNMNGSAANRITSGGSGITGTTLGAAGGAETHTLTTAQLAVTTPTGSFTGNALGTHSHTVGGGSSDFSGTAGLRQGSAAPTNNYNTSAVSAGTPSGTITMDSFGSGNAHNNTQPTIMFNTIIKT